MKIGALEIEAPLVLAPMAAVTNAPYRRLCREQGAGLVVTEMVSAKGVVADDPRSWRFVDLRPDEHPVCVQLFGDDPAELAEAARKVEAYGADAVDVNMGCPMKKVVKTGRGAALLREPHKVEAIMRAMTDAVDVPVTAKIRAGWEETNAAEVGRALEAGGAAAVTIHGRTRCAMYDDHVDLDIIGELVDAVSIPVIGNGDVKDVPSARHMFERTGCAAVMVARGCLGNPWVFAELRGWLDGRAVEVDRSPRAVLAMVLRHFELYLADMGEKATCLQFRKHALWYYRGSAGEAVLKQRMRHLQTADDVRAALAAAAAAVEADEAELRAARPVPA